MILLEDVLPWFQHCCERLAQISGTWRFLCKFHWQRLRWLGDGQTDRTGRSGGHRSQKLGPTELFTGQVGTNWGPISAILYYLTKRVFSLVLLELKMLMLWVGFRVKLRFIVSFVFCYNGSRGLDIYTRKYFDPKILVNPTGFMFGYGYGNLHTQNGVCHRIKCKILVQLLDWSCLPCPCPGIW